MKESSHDGELSEPCLPVGGLNEARAGAEEQLLADVIILVSELVRCHFPSVPDHGETLLQKLGVGLLSKFYITIYKAGYKAPFKHCEYSTNKTKLLMNDK